MRRIISILILVLVLCTIAQTQAVPITIDAVGEDKISKIFAKTVSDAIFSCKTFRVKTLRDSVNLFVFTNIEISGKDLAYTVCWGLEYKENITITDYMKGIFLYGDVVACANELTYMAFRITQAANSIKQYFK